MPIGVGLTSKIKILEKLYFPFAGFFFDHTDALDITEMRFKRIRTGQDTVSVWLGVLNLHECWQCIGASKKTQSRCRCPETFSCLAFLGSLKLP